MRSDLELTLKDPHEEHHDTCNICYTVTTPLSSRRPGDSTATTTWHDLNKLEFLFWSAPCI